MLRGMPDDKGFAPCSSAAGSAVETGVPCRSLLMRWMGDTRLFGGELRETDHHLPDVYGLPGARW